MGREGIARGPITGPRTNSNLQLAFPLPSFFFLLSILSLASFHFEGLSLHFYPWQNDILQWNVMYHPTLPSYPYILAILEHS